MVGPDGIFSLADGADAWKHIVARKVVEQLFVQLGHKYNGNSFSKVDSFLFVPTTIKDCLPDVQKPRWQDRHCSLLGK